MKSGLKWASGGTVAALVTLLWPGPSVSADTSLGGYQGIAEASVVHIELYEPVIPIPSTPAGDLSVGYTKSNVDSGPTSRALASYLWPGVVLGDGFEQLIGQPGATYPVQVNSRYPATDSAPEKNAAQLTDGNGMTTSTDGFTTTATTTGLGLAGPNTNLLSGLLKGLPQLIPKLPGSKPLPLPNTGAVQVPVGPALAALVTSTNLSSTSSVTVADKTVTADAEAHVAALSLIGGLIKIAGLNVESKVVSDGAKATTDATADIGGISIAGVPIALDNKGAGLALPPLTTAVSNILKNLGITIAAIPVTQAAPGADGTATAQALQISIDTTPLKKIVDSVLNPLLALFPPSALQQLQPILALSPRIVLTIGNSNAAASAAPAYNGGTGGDFGGGSTGGNTGGGVTGGGGTLPTDTGGSSTPSQAAPMQPPSQTVAFPGLGKVPRYLILGAIALAALLGWLLTTSAGFLFGAARNCDYGLTTGVPDLRKE